MSFEKVKELLLNARIPFDVFGDCNVLEIKKKYREFAKIIHPDLVYEFERNEAEQITKILNEMYKSALHEIEEGIYGIFDSKQLFKNKKSLFEFDLKGNNYKFYRQLGEDDVSYIFDGISGEDEIILKYPIEESDNDLINNEYEVLSSLEHVSLPKVISKININGHTSLILKKAKGKVSDEIKRDYGFLDAEHVCWILERLLSVVGLLHSKKIVHGNIKPENLLIDVENHNVTLLDYSLCIKDADKYGSKYKIVNEFYTPKYVSSSSCVKPCTDIYALGIYAIDLMGGDIERIALPLTCDVRIRQFIRKLVSLDYNDAWVLWDELRNLRTLVYGSERFKKLEMKRK